MTGATVHLPQPGHRIVGLLVVADFEVEAGLLAAGPPARVPDRCTGGNVTAGSDRYPLHPGINRKDTVAMVQNHEVSVFREPLGVDCPATVDRPHGGAGGQPERDAVGKSPGVELRMAVTPEGLDQRPARRPVEDSFPGTYPSGGIGSLGRGR